MAASPKKARTPAQLAADERQRQRVAEAKLAGEGGGQVAVADRMATARSRGLESIQQQRAAVAAAKAAQSAQGRPTRDEEMLAGRAAQAPSHLALDAAAEFGQDFKEAQAAGLEGVYVTTTEPEQYVVYDDWGIARRIRRDTYAEVRRGVTTDGHRLHAECPLCGKLHPESEVNPNACKMRQLMRGKQCPECGKVVWGDLPSQFANGNHPDPNVEQVQVDDKALERLADRNFRMHVGTYHPALADTLGISVNPLAGNVSTGNPLLAAAGRAA